MTLVRADGTQITKTDGEALVEAVPEERPRVRVAENVYEVFARSGTRYPPVGKRLLFHEGQIVERAAWDAAFPPATITSVVPATGPAAGGTRVTINGSGFSPGTAPAIGGTAMTDVQVVDDGQIEATTPAGTAGAAQVGVVTDAGPGSNTVTFTYA